MENTEFVTFLNELERDMRKMIRDVSSLKSCLSSIERKRRFMMRHDENVKIIESALGHQLSLLSNISEPNSRTMNIDALKRAREWFRQNIAGKK